MSARRLALLAAAFALAALPARAHENRPGFLEMEEKSPGVLARMALCMSVSTIPGLMATTSTPRGPVCSRPRHWATRLIPALEAQ